jgi:hypothetical protein
MPARDCETAINDFLLLGNALQGNATPITGKRVLQELTEWYRTSRIAGAALQDGGDMLLLQWGCAQPQLGILEPTDLRQANDREVAFDDRSLQYLDFTRQVCPTDGDPDEFDQLAVQMSIALYYQPATGREPNSNIWIREPEAIDRALRRYQAIPYIKSLLALPATRISITVEHCG